MKNEIPHEDLDPAAVRDAIPHEAIAHKVIDAIPHEAIARKVKGEFPEEDIDPAAVREAIPDEETARIAVEDAIPHDHIAHVVREAISHNDTARAVRDALREDIANAVIGAIPHEAITRAVIKAIPHGDIANAVIDAFLYGEVGKVYNKYALKKPEEDSQAVELPQVHLLVRLISAFLEHRYGRWVGILSESNAPIEKWKKYFGEGSGAKLNYQFHRMQGLWSSLVLESRTPLMRALSVTFDSPRRCAGVMFGRVHDELTVDNADGEVMEHALDLLSSRVDEHVPQEGEPGYEAYRDYQHQDPNRRYGFYNRSIAARMETLLRALPKNPQAKSDDEDLVEKYGLMMRLLMALDDVPLIYMGDEWGERVNWEYLAEQSGRDMRHVHRPIADKELPVRLTSQPDEVDRGKLALKIHSITENAIRARRESLVMQHGTLDLVTDPEGVEDVLAFTRTLADKRVLVVCNLGHRSSTSR